MIEKLIALTKSEASAFSGIWKSKKFALVIGWAVFSGMYADSLLATNPQLAVHALYAGVAPIVAYVVCQSWIERHGVQIIADVAGTEVKKG